MEGGLGVGRRRDRRSTLTVVFVVTFIILIFLLNSGHNGPIPNKSGKSFFIGCMSIYR